ncbi:MAG: GNAT family N-acetyltransferase, partial [Bacteroidota bacterium]
MSGFPNFSTNRLLLRPFRLTDAPAFFALNDDPEVMRYVPDSPFRNIAEARTFLANYLPIYETGYGRLGIVRKFDNTFVGWCGLKPSSYNGVVDLGFRLHRQFWNRGYATEASKKCLRYGFEELNLDRIVGRCAERNLASQRVLIKIGMRLVGKFQEPDWSGLEY